ncbi:hypothetical protein M514_23131 [Trichuris suis]|uniref:Uncharacterized protein n=1 Tax=Trichuris suis TaxID=68888 RepID=A0A085N5C7_9BILA|nr:hypothetical protein M514_23131 [Trichuris suis]
MTATISYAVRTIPDPRTILSYVLQYDGPGAPPGGHVPHHENHCHRRCNLSNIPANDDSAIARLAVATPGEAALEDSNDDSAIARLAVATPGEAALEESREPRIPCLR